MVISYVRNDRCAMVLIVFAHLMAVTAQIIPLDKPVAPFIQQLLQYQWETRGVAAGTLV